MPKIVAAYCYYLSSAANDLLQVVWVHDCYFILAEFLRQACFYDPKTEVRIERSQIRSWHRRRPHAKEKPVRNNPLWHAGREPHKHASAVPTHHRFIGSKHNFGAGGSISSWQFRHRSITPNLRHTATAFVTVALTGFSTKSLCFFAMARVKKRGAHI